MDRAINNNDQRMIGGTFVFGYVINSLQCTIKDYVPTNSDRYKQRTIIQTLHL
jgi:hypothetical protein